MPTPSFTPTNRSLKPAPGQLINFRIQRPGVNPTPPGLYAAAGPMPGLYSQEPAAPPRVAPVPRIPNNFAPAGDVALGGGALEPDAAAGGTPLPVGAAVEGVPGLFESVHAAPRLNDPAGVVAPGSAFTASGTVAQPAAAPSRFTLRQTTAPASSRPPSPLDANADAVALASLFDTGAPVAERGTGNRSAAPAADSFSELGAAGSALQAAQGLERTRLGLAAQRIMQREAQNIPRADQSPEIQASRLAYMTKRVGGAASAAGLPGSTSELARTAAEITRNAGQPRLVNLGTDSSGNPVEGTLDANRNFSRIAPKDATSGGTQLAKLISERDAFSAAGRTEIAKQYDEVISNYHAFFDAFGNPVSRNTAQGDPFEEQDMPHPKTRAERDALPPGTRYLAPNGRVATTLGAAPGAQPASSAPPAKPSGAASVDQQALAWANANPNDPRAAQIKARLGQKLTK